MLSIFRLVTAVLFLSVMGHAEDIRGSVVIKQRLTRKRVTQSATVYQRGPTVELRSDAEADPLPAERSRVVVYLDGSGAPRPDQATAGSISMEQFSMEQKDRRFVPELLTIPVGSTVTFPNLDPIFHNVFSLSKPKSFDLGNYPKDHTRSVQFTKPGIVFVNCHLHPNMSAAIVVTPTVWSATVDRGGQFQLHDVPPGTYTVVAWHRAAGFFKQQVRVLPSAGATVEFFVPLDENGVSIQKKQSIARAAMFSAATSEHAHNAEPGH